MLVICKGGKGLTFIDVLEPGTSRVVAHSTITVTLGGVFISTR